MKTIHGFSIREAQVTPPAYKQLVALAPPGRDIRGSLICGFEKSDPKLLIFQTVLRDAGCVPWIQKWRAPAKNEYDYSIDREYTHGDLMHYDYLQLIGIGAEPWNGWLNDEKTAMMLERSERPWSARDASTGRQGQPLCSTRLRAELENWHFQGLRFLPTELRDNPSSPGGGTLVPWAAVNDEPWWRLQSDITLPPLATSMDLRDLSGNPQRLRGVTPREGAYERPELHYDRAAFEAVGPFDAAVTLEHIWGIHDAQRMIVSMRFYELSHQLRLPWEFLPVHLDDPASPAAPTPGSIASPAPDGKA